VRISYGKLRVPVHRIEGDDVFACEVSVEVLGDNFAPAYTEGDNSAVVATDTMKNFILREALHHDGATLEGFLAFLGERMIATYPVMQALRVSGRELRFDRLAGKVFSRSGDDHAVAAVEIGPDGVTDVRGGRHGRMLLKTSGSAFTRFARDE
jgi:urate oxidase/2-oxo-4-hydroxy-4-carboxy-5-ureidoimidazoline decarboxylase